MARRSGGRAREQGKGKGKGASRRGSSRARVRTALGELEHVVSMLVALIKNCDRGFAGKGKGKGAGRLAAPS